MEANSYRVMERAVEEGVRHGWHRSFKHLDPGQAPSEGSAVGTITDAVMLHISEYFNFDSPCFTTRKEMILEVIDRALKAKEDALDEGNREQMGYPYCAGYMESALVQVAAILQSSASVSGDGEM